MLFLLLLLFLAMIPIQIIVAFACAFLYLFLLETVVPLFSDVLFIYRFFRHFQNWDKQR